METAEDTHMHNPPKEHSAQLVLGVKDRFLRSGGFVFALAGIIRAEDGNDSLEDLQVDSICQP